MEKMFSDLLTQTTSLYGISYVKLEQLLKEKGLINISRSRLSEYGRKIATPPIDKARAIMDALEYEISDEDLRESLRLNKIKIKQDRTSDKEKGYRSRAQVYIGYYNIRNLIIQDKNQGIIDIDIEQPGKDIKNQIKKVKDIISKRMITVTGGEGSLTRYIEKLIADDLLNNKEE